MDANNSQKDLYFVAVKIFLENEEKLLILKDAHGQWDLPGGRIKKDEFSTPLEQILQRKMSEELGTDLKCQIDPLPKIFMRHSRPEKVGEGLEAKIFGLGYIATLLSGEIRLSPAHTELKWVDIHSFDPKDYFTGGWLAGVEEYLKFKKI